MKKNLEIGIYDYLNMDIPFEQLSEPRNKKDMKKYLKRARIEVEKNDNEYAENIIDSTFDSSDDDYEELSHEDKIDIITDCIENGIDEYAQNLCISKNEYINLYELADANKNRDYENGDIIFDELIKMR